MCLVLECSIGLAVNDTVLRLSHHNVVLLLILTFNSLSRDSIHISSAVALATLLNLASVLDLDTVVCFF